MKLGQRLDAIKALQDEATEGIDWKVFRCFPNIEVGGSEISFGGSGDFVSKEEAIEALQLLLDELR